jgi:transcriptional regulator with GAF, ATPase, and Fis domain
MARDDDRGTTVPSTTSNVPVPRIELTVVREAEQPVSRAAVLDGDVLRIGSHPSNDIVLADPRVSRFHCRLARGREAWRIVDTDSTNGTAVDGVRVRDAELRMPSCTIELGGSAVTVRELASAERVTIVNQPCVGALYGKSLAMQKLFTVLERVAKSEANVLVEGESGTGKELVATEVARRGPRADKPFVVVDCGAISPSLIESELFGHARGAFTGADRERAGVFEAASGGTVFLDEIGEMPLEMQPKLLRVIESREVRRVGETKARKVDVRLIAATNRRLEREVNRGRFREDLYFRLSVVTLRIPPLRDRPEDVPLLVNVFLEALDALDKQRLFTPEVLGELSAREWPGNVRELRNYVERAVVLEDTGAPSGDEGIDEEPASVAPGSIAPVNLDVPFRAAKDRAIGEFERRYLAALVAWSGGNLSRAARRARMDRMNLHRLVQLYGLRASRSLRD